MRNKKKIEKVQQLEKILEYKLDWSWSNIEF